MWSFDESIKITLSIESTWFAEDCPQPVLLPHTVTALDIARWYAHGMASFLPAPSFCDVLRTYLPVWRLPVPERWCFVPRSIEEGAMRCYRSAIREALARGRGSAGAHDIAAVLEEWAAAPVFFHPDLDNICTRILVDRTLEVSDHERTETEIDAKIQYRVINRKPYLRRLPLTVITDCWIREPDWQLYPWSGQTHDLIGAYFYHEGAEKSVSDADVMGGYIERAL
jgi:hypothetical protein